MTLTTVIVLHLALVCSSVGILSERTTDNTIKHKRMRSMKDSLRGLHLKDIYDKNLRIDTQTDAFNLFNGRLNYVDKFNYDTNSNNEREISTDDAENCDEIYTENDEISDEYFNNFSSNNDNTTNSSSSIKDLIMKTRVKRDEKTNKCDSFTYEKGKTFISHPHIGDSDYVNYSSNTYCTTVIEGPVGTVVQLTFIEMFHIEEHPDCDYDFLEIRDGDRGYYDLLRKVCGDEFPQQITTTGPYAWLKFYSDDTIEYKGFRIQIDFISKDTSYSVPDSCTTSLSGIYGKINSSDLNPNCNSSTGNHPLDYLWRIDVEHGHKIYLNFTTYAVGQPNECDKNYVQVYGSVLEFDAKLAHYCGSVANSVSTMDQTGKGGEFEDEGNTMHVRIYSVKGDKTSTYVHATFTAFRILDLSKNNTCDADTEFDCQDNTCIDISLRCDNYANCRLKADEEKDLCKHTTESLLHKPGIKMIVSVFCVILSGIIIVIIYKCIMKFYNDHKTIKEQMSKSCEDKLDSMFGSQLLLDSKKMQSDTEPRESLERDNQTNEMFKQQRKLHEDLRPISIDSDFIPEVHRDLEKELWHGKINDYSKTDDDGINTNGKIRRKGMDEIMEEIKIETNDKTKINDDAKTERKERKRKEKEQKEFRNNEELTRKKKSEERNLISETRNVSVGVPDTKQSACQTRESLFDTEPIMSSNGSSSSNNRGSSKFGYVGPSTSKWPTLPQIKPSEIVIEIISPNVEQERKSQKKILADRRPMSAETTRSAPDVIVLAKP